MISGAAHIIMPWLEIAFSRSLSGGQTADGRNKAHGLYLTRAPDPDCARDRDLKINHYCIQKNAV
jgi:hypothetical protein